MQDMRVEMIGGVHGMVQFKLDEPEPTRIAGPQVTHDLSVWLCVQAQHSTTQHSTAHTCCPSQIRLQCTETCAWEETSGCFSLWLS